LDDIVNMLSLQCFSSSTHYAPVWWCL